MFLWGRNSTFRYTLDAIYVTKLVLAVAETKPLIRRLLISLASLYPGAFCQIYYLSDGSTESLHFDKTS
jgi:hypothetical protein